MVSESFRILLVGSGGREHALAWKLVQSPRCADLIVAPGNPGIEELEGVRTAPVSGDDQQGLLELAERERIDLVVCGPEAPLVAGLGDAFRARGTTRTSISTPPAVADITSAREAPVVSGSAVCRDPTRDRRRVFRRPCAAA